MDHKRIEWLFLIVFLLIDLYLAFDIWRSPVNLSNNNANLAGETDMRTEMHADGIDLPAKLSQNQASGYYLAAKNRDYLSKRISKLGAVNADYSKSSNTLSARPKTPVPLTGSSQQVVKKLLAFKNNPRNVPYGRQYRYEPNMSSNNSYTFVQTSPYGRIYDTSAQLIFNRRNGQLESYTLTYMGQVAPVRELQSTISPWHAVRAMYTNQELNNNSRVLKIKLGYSELTEVRGSTILLPTWLVWIENKTTKNIVLKRVNAYTAQILPTNASYDVEK